MTGDEWSQLPMGEPARRALRNAGYAELMDLTHVPRKAIVELHGMGPKALGILEAELASRGLSFRTD